MAGVPDDGIIEGDTLEDRHPMHRRTRTIRAVMAALLMGSTLVGQVAADEPGSRVLAYGHNGYGQVGDGTTEPRLSPVEIAGMDDIVSVAAGTYHALALRADGRVHAWGDNRQGQLGDGTQVGRHAPQLVPNLTHVVKIAAGANFSLAIRSDGSVWEWGSRATEDPGTWQPALLEPTRVDGLSGVALDGGVGHRIVATSTGGVVAWGYNGGGQLGDGTAVDRWDPAPMDGAEDVQAVTGGLLHSAVLFDDGGVAAVGGNAYGQLGDGTHSDRLHLARIDGIDDAVQIAAGDGHMLALLDDGTVLSWGHEIGLGIAYTGIGDRPVPGSVPSLTGVTGIRAGRDTSMAITAAGIWSWGWATGVEDAWISDVPVFIEGTADASDAAPGHDFGVILIDGVSLALPPPVVTTSSAVASPMPDSAGDVATFTVTITPAPDTGTVTMGPDPTTVKQTAPIDPATGTATFVETIAGGPAAAARHFRFSGAPGFLPSGTSLALDVVGPTVGSASARLKAGATASAGTIPIQLTWTGSDALTGVAAFDIEDATARGKTMTRVRATDPATIRGVVPARTYRYRIRGLDRAGNAGAWTATANVRVEVIDDRDPRIRTQGTWTRMSSGSAWGGSAYVSTASGARVSLTYHARAIAWLATVGPGRSKVNVYVDGVRTQTIDLFAPTAGHRLVTLGATWPSAGTHTLTLANVGTSGRARLDLDAFVVLTQP